MAVPVFMQFLTIPRKVVTVPVMLVMDVPMGMVELLMQVLVLMAFCKVKPNPQCHQAAGQPEPRTGVFTQQDQ